MGHGGGMSETVPEILRVNMAFAWVWMLGGFVSGALMGMRFKEERWLGGYGSFRRRMVRLGHISFFGLGLVNFMFAVTGVWFGLEGGLMRAAGIAFLAGGVLMPVCCGAMARWEGASPVAMFAAPVGSLLAGGGLTLKMIILP